MSAHNSLIDSLNVDELSQEAENFQKAIQSIRASTLALQRHGYDVSIIRHDSQSHDIERHNDTDLTATSRNPGSTLYWKDVRRIADERGITASEARQVIRDRQKRRQLRLMATT